MAFWYKTIRDDITLLPDCLEFYQKEYEDAQKEVKLMGSGNLERASSSLPHIMEHRFSQLQDLESILRHLNIQYERMRAEVFKKWFENQKVARALTSREAEKYVDLDDGVNTLAQLVNDVSFSRNMFLSILKGIDAKSWQIQNLTKLHCAGLTDARV